MMPSQRLAKMIAEAMVAEDVLGLSSDMTLRIAQRLINRGVTVPGERSVLRGIDPALRGIEGQYRESGLSRISVVVGDE